MTASSHDAPAADCCLIEFQRVCLSISGKSIVHDLSFTIRAGEFVCVIGPSGCGKTTLLRLLGGLLSPGSGKILRNGEPVRGPSHDVAIVFQDYGRALLPWRNASDNVSLALEARAVPRASRAPLIAQALSKVNLTPHSQKFPAQLSGGMQQRLQIARCLAQEPSVLLMDEPFGALDAMTRQSLQDEISDLVRVSGSTVLFITHDLDEALYLGDRVIALKANPGEIAQTIEVDLPRPRNQLTTREDPEYLRLRRFLFDFVQEHH